MISSTPASSGTLTVLETAPEMKGCTAPSMRTCPSGAMLRTPAAGRKAQSKIGRCSGLSASARSIVPSASIAETIEAICSSL